MADHLTPAFQQLTDTNRGPLVIVTTYIFLCTSGLAVFTKIWTRLAATSRLAWTDWTILAAWICFLGQAIALTVAVNHGIGRHVYDLTTSQLETASKALYASNILLPIVLGGAKASISILILSVQPFPGPAKTACHIFLGVVGAWTVAAIFAFAFQCNVPSTWAIMAPTSSGTCGNQHAIEIGLGIVNMLTDFATVVLAFFMIKTVQISLQRKCIIMLLFGLRLVTPPFAVLALVTSSSYYASEPQDRTWDAVTPLIWTQVMIGVSVITAVIPSIKRFFDMVTSGVSGVPVSTAEQYELSQSRSGSVISLGKKFAAKIGSATSKSRSRVQSEAMASRNFSIGNIGHSASRYSVQVTGGQETDSIRRLAESGAGIQQRTEYEVGYEENSIEVKR